MIYESDDEDENLFKKKKKKFNDNQVFEKYYVDDEYKKYSYIFGFKDKLEKLKIRYSDQPEDVLIDSLEK
jgi:hypothetical protein